MRFGDIVASRISGRLDMVMWESNIEIDGYKWVIYIVDTCTWIETDTKPTDRDMHTYIIIYTGM